MPPLVGESEIDERDIPGLVIFHEKILQFQVAMRYLLSMHILYGVHHVPEYYLGLFFGERVGVTETGEEFSPLAVAVWIERYSKTRKRLWVSSKVSYILMILGWSSFPVALN